MAHLGPGAQGLAPLPGKNGQPGNRGNAGQGFAAEAQTTDILQFHRFPQLGGGVPLQAEEYIVLVHTFAIIAHPYKTHATAFHLDIHPGRTGVQAVFHQFLDHRGWAVHHFTGSDLVGNLF